MELGNMLFNESNKNQTYECPKWVEWILLGIDGELGQLHWNTFQKLWDSPFENTGTRFDGSNFTVKAYAWDGEQEWNFKYKDIEISWYKYLGRDTTINIDPKSKDFIKRIVDMANDIIDGLPREAI